MSTERGIFDRSTRLLTLVSPRSRLVMLERFEVQRREGFVLATRVGATVLAFDFAEYANDRARIVTLRQGTGTCRRLVGHRYRPHPSVEPCGEPIGVKEAEEAANTHSPLIMPGAASAHASPGPALANVTRA